MPELAPQWAESDPEASIRANLAFWGENVRCSLSPQIVGVDARKRWRYDIFRKRKWFQSRGKK